MRKFLVLAAALAAAVFVVPASAGAGVRPHGVGLLDCNGRSPVQKSVRVSLACSDPRSIYDGKSVHFFDNGQYIGHDEPIIRFLSKRHGSGNDITWLERLPRDPKALPTVANPGSDVTHWFELSIAPWFSMALCNAESYPLNPCRPRSDSNAPKHPPTFDKGGGGSSFLEMQFYAPGFAPFVDNESCDNTHWCASLHINDLECSAGFATCNNNCIEPTNFAFIETNGVPMVPPSPQLATAASFTPNQNPSDEPGRPVRIHMWDGGARRGPCARDIHRRPDDGQERVHDRVRQERLHAHVLRGLLGDAVQLPARVLDRQEGEHHPVAALETNISTQFEIGHFEPCTSVQNPMPITLGTFHDTIWQDCTSPYESTTMPDGGSNPEISDAPCWPKGFTHGRRPAQQGGGVHPDHRPERRPGLRRHVRRADWPSRTTPSNWPSPLPPDATVDSRPRIPADPVPDERAGERSQLPSDRRRMRRSSAWEAPGKFYPWWTQAKVNGECVWEFGQMRNGNTFGRTSQYGGPSAYFFGNLEGPIRANQNC